MLSSFMQKAKRRRVVGDYSFLALLPFNCSFHSYMNMKNDYDDKYVEKGGEKRRLGCLNSYLA
jgi:hypothetical protein